MSYKYCHDFTNFQPLVSLKYFTSFKGAFMVQILRKIYFKNILRKIEKKWRFYYFKELIHKVRILGGRRGCPAIRRFVAK